MIKALADKREVAVKASQKYLQSVGLLAAQEFFGSENAWKKLVELPDLDLIYIYAHHGCFIHQFRYMLWNRANMLLAKFPLHG